MVDKMSFFIPKNSVIISISQDNQEEATIGAFLICELVETLSRSNDVDDEISEILLDMESKCNRPILHCVLFY